LNDSINWKAGYPPAFFFPVNCSLKGIVKHNTPIATTAQKYAVREMFESKVTKLNLGTRLLKGILTRQNWRFRWK